LSNDSTKNKELNQIVKNNEHQSDESQTKAVVKSPSDNQSRKQKLIQALLENPSDVAQAGRIAGYADSYIGCGKFYQFVSRLRTSDEFKKAAFEYIQGTDLISKVLRVAKIDDEVLKMLENDPGRYPKLAAVPKQIKQQAGLLAPDVPPTETAQVTIKQLQVLISGDFNVANRCITRSDKNNQLEIPELIEDTDIASD